MEQLIYRNILEKIRPWLRQKEMLVLLGARQVGKTSILKLLQHELKDEPTFYFDLENTFELELCATPERSPGVFYSSLDDIALFASLPSSILRNY